MEIDIIRGGRPSAKHDGKFVSKCPSKERTEAEISERERRIARYRWRVRQHLPIFDDTPV